MRPCADRSFVRPTVRLFCSFGRSVGRSVIALPIKRSGPKASRHWVEHDMPMGGAVHHIFRHPVVRRFHSFGQAEVGRVVEEKCRRVQCLVAEQLAREESTNDGDREGDDEGQNCMPACRTGRAEFSSGESERFLPGGSLRAVVRAAPSMPCARERHHEACASFAAVPGPPNLGYPAR